MAVILVATPTAAFAHPASISSTITVSGVVPPRVLLIINSSGNIDKIFSNSDQDGEPMALNTSIDGQVVPMTDSLLTQYKTIKPTLDFKYGYIYQKMEVEPTVTASPPQPTIKNFFLSSVELTASRLLGVINV